MPVSPEVKLSSKAGLKPGTALGCPISTCCFTRYPTGIRITAAYSIKRVTREVQSVLKVADYACRNEYAMPLEGLWLMKAMPAAGVMDHHRFAAASEFGVDFLKWGQAASCTPTTAAGLVIILLTAKGSWPPPEEGGSGRGGPGPGMVAVQPKRGGDRPGVSTTAIQTAS